MCKTATKNVSRKNISKRFLSVLIRGEANVWREFLAMSEESTFWAVSLLNTFELSCVIKSFNELLFEFETFVEDCVVGTLSAMVFNWSSEKASLAFKNILMDKSEWYINVFFRFFSVRYFFNQFCSHSLYFFS